SSPYAAGLRFGRRSAARRARRSFSFPRRKIFASRWTRTPPARAGRRTRPLAEWLSTATGATGTAEPARTRGSPRTGRVTAPTAEFAGRFEPAGRIRPAVKFAARARAGWPRAGRRKFARRPASPGRPALAIFAERFRAAEALLTAWASAALIAKSPFSFAA